MPVSLKYPHTHTSIWFIHSEMWSTYSLDRATCVFRYAFEGETLIFAFRVQQLLRVFFLVRPHYVVVSRTCNYISILAIRSFIGFWLWVSMCMCVFVLLLLFIFSVFVSIHQRHSYLFCCRCILGSHRHDTSHRQR